MNERDIFIAARHIASPEDRRRYLDEACGSDVELRRQVEGLLQAQQDAGSFLQSPAAAAYSPTISERPISEAPGTVIGPYKLLEQIGEGGFGVVFMAEQTAPVKRKVALKVIKPGMDTRQVIARFEAERQALALMDHPHIAKVLDAGTTETGRPYFVMELVRGIPITEYCDQAQLAPRERLELFVTVCHAVQHAHQKGIIHRDIKPTNVLVTLHDDRPVVKVIDFGVAKATSGHLTDKTLFTGFAQMIGTPLYMSPEQAAMSGLDIDTRSDIYSLGVLLYELLTGTTPFDKTRLQQAAFDEVRRIIREEEPQKPSTRLSDLGRSGLPSRTGGALGAASQTGHARQAGPTSLASVAALRKTEPRKLSQLVRGDLDWIVMKALDKDRARRYETANGFAADVLRHLADEPVTACPPSAGYRFRKFSRRNRTGLATAAMVAAALVAGIIGTTWQAIRAMHEADRATHEASEAKAARANEAAQTQIAVREKQAAVDARNVARQKETEALNALQEVDRQRLQANENFDKARRAVDAYLNQVTESELLTVPGLQPLREDLLRAALEFYAEFTRERADDPMLQRELASAHYRLGRIHSELGSTEACTTANAEAIRLYEQLRDAGHFDPDTQVELARAYFFDKRYDDTMRLCQDVLLAEAGHAEARSLLADCWSTLAKAESDSNDIEAAFKHHRQAFELRESLVRDAPDNPRYLAQLGGSVNNLGVLLSKQTKYEEALALYERAVEYMEQAYERAPHSLLWGQWLCNGLSNVADTQAALGQDQEALASYQRRVAVSRKRAFENPAVTSLRGYLSWTHLSLARYQQQLGNAAEASRSFREAREVLENIPRETPDQLYELATVYAALAQPPQGAIEPDQEAAAERQRHIELTLQTLRKAIDAGYARAQTLKTERLFDVLRDRDDFQQLIALLEKAAQAQQLASRNAAGTVEQQLADRLQAAELLRDVVAAPSGGLRHRTTLAATLHSIGVIQTGLKQFGEAEKSFNQALEAWDTVRQAQPGKSEPEVDWLGTRIALANLYWSSARFPQGHRILRDCSQRLLTIADAGRDNAALQQRIAEYERLICNAYGRFGLWPLAGQYVLRSAEFQRVSSHAQDAEFAALLLFPENTNAADAYLSMLAAITRSAEERETWRVTHLVRTAALARTNSLTSDELVSRARRALALQNGNPWWAMVLSIALYRAGEFQEAQDLIRGLGQMGDHAFSYPQIYYVQSIVASALGDDADARTCLARGESLYRQACLESLAQPAVDSLGLPSANWHELIHVQAQRREALRLIEGREPGDDPWQHLIQARGYRLIGEIEQADQELAAAAAATPDDPDVWMARARLLAQWDDPEQPAEAAWKRALDLAGNDPVIWIHRGRWYAERGEQAKAEADFARAFQLEPDHLLCRLERAKQYHSVIAAWDFSQGTAGVRDHADCKLSVANGILTIDSTGGDPVFVSPEFNAGPGRKELTICARIQGTQAWQLFLWTTHSRYTEEESVRFVLDGGDGEWREHRVTFDPRADLKELRFDPPNEAGVHVELAWIMLADASAEADWRRTVERAGHDPAPWIERAHWYAGRGELAKADADWQRAVELADNDPLPWIQRGRWYAERGEHDKADADFAKAASLTPNELNKFPAAGWWAVGPYPPGLKESCPPEIDPDPSRPVPVMNAESGLSDEPAPWVSVPTGAYGAVDLSGVPGARAGSSVYALSHVWSPDERGVLLMLGKTVALRVWVNDVLIENFTPGQYPEQPHYDQFHRVPVVLRRGRNTVLVKSPSTGFALRIGDTARDRALLLAEQRRFTEALALLNEPRFPAAEADLESGFLPWSLIPVLTTHDGPQEPYQQQCAAALARISEVDRLEWLKFRISWVCSQRPNPLFEQHAERLISLAEEYAQEHPAMWTRLNAALVNYRAGRCEQALSLLTPPDLAHPLTLPLHSLLNHRLGNAPVADTSLEAAFSAAAEVAERLKSADRSDLMATTWACWWYEWAQFLNLLAEAEQAIRGETTAADELRSAAEATQVRGWTESPELAAFDQAVLFTARGPDGLLKYPWPLLARGRRLAELGRFAEAEADFNKAVELAPDDIDILQARDLFHAQRVTVEQKPPP